MEENVQYDEHLLSNLEDNIERADTGKRLANYIIDIVVFYALFIGLGVVIAIVSPETLDGMADDSPGFGLGERIISLLLYALYMFIMEALFKGKSIGKFITGTRAVNFDGSRITIGTAMLRALSRAVPFCVFSALSSPCNPWHDKWTNTVVMDERKSATI
jgi:uncharacterized RDD family membrane protein YckC